MKNILVIYYVAFCLLGSVDLKSQSIQFAYENGKRVSKTVGLASDKTIKGDTLINTRCGVVYSIDSSTGYQYYWEVVGGDILNGQNTDSITVNWQYSGRVSVTETDPGSQECPSAYTLPITLDLDDGITAQFEADSTFGYSPFTVNFTDISVGEPTIFEWDFGDGNSSKEQNPQHTYAQPGQYAVELTAINGCDTARVMLSDSIRVLEPLKADFIFDPKKGTVPLTVQFADFSTGSPSHWEWDFGDDSVSFEQNPRHTYNQIGEYRVKLTISNEYDTATHEKIGFIKVIDSLQAGFTSDVLTGFVPLAVQFSDTSSGSPTKWVWDFGDSKTSPLQNPLHEYEEPGIYTVKLVVENAHTEDKEVKEEYIDVQEILGLEDESRNVSAYPNPTKNMVTVKSEQKMVSITILDLTGKPISSITECDNWEQGIDIDVSGLEHAIYFFEIKGVSFEEILRIIVN